MFAMRLRTFASDCCLVSLLLCISAGSAAGEVSWLDDLDQATRQATSQQRPILVWVQAEYCAWCKQLEQELQAEPVQTELQRWTTVQLDIQRWPAEVRRLAVTGTPALRILTPRGQTVASHDGVMAEQALVAWLQEHYTAAVDAPDDVLLATGEPGVLEVVRLLRNFENRNASLRQAAVRRLAPYPETAASAVVNELQEGRLLAQLVAHELLIQWGAPVDEIDPWRPETLTEQRLAALTDWARNRPALPDQGGETAARQRIAELQQEFDRLLQGDHEEAVAARERLVAWGTAARELVLTRLETATTDLERERLLSMRYRLVADDALVLRWPGGLERLADTDPQVRREAAEELASMATLEQQDLLLELFTDADPLVREISLRGLKDIGGAESAQALAALLRDPEPNVRAAVLKQLAEDAPSSMVTEIAAYAQRETDPDLLVHAIRYLGQLNEKTSRDALAALATHESWQVRAEAVEALGKGLDNYYGFESDVEESLEIYDILLERLDDPDAFVVGRTLQALDQVNAPRAVEPLVAAAAKHPALASLIIELLAKGSTMREAALPHLRDFFQTGDPTIRAAAIKGLARLNSDQLGTELLAGLDDDTTDVRIASADALLIALEALRPNDDAQSGVIYSASSLLPPRISRGLGAGDFEVEIEILESADQIQVEAIEEPEDPPETREGEHSEPKAASPEDGSAGESEQAESSDQWLSELYAGQHRPEWTKQLVPPLEEMLNADSTAEQLAALLALIPLGHSQQALPHLMRIAEDDASQRAAAAGALTWLTWDDREKLFWRLEELASTDGARLELVRAMNEAPHPELAGVYWQLLDRRSDDKALAALVQEGLQQALLGSYYDVSALTTSARKRALLAIEPAMSSGSARKRLVAMSLLLPVAGEEVADAAQLLMDNPDVDAALRAEAFQMLLAAQGSSERTQSAIAVLENADPARQRIALDFLATGESALRQFKATGVTVYSFDSFSMYNQSARAIIPQPPRGLQAEQVRPLIQHNDPEIAAYAGYLLCLCGESEGLEPLLAYWKSSASKEQFDRLVYRAIAILDDAQYIPVLKEIYARTPEYELSEFYWTIRIMSGQEILQFRKRIRDEKGMDNLR